MLSQAGTGLVERDFFKDPFSREELKRLADIVTIDELFAWRSPSSRAYRDRRGELSEDDLLDLMMDEPRLIRRPITIRSDDARRFVLGGRTGDLQGLTTG